MGHSTINATTVLFTGFLVVSAIARADVFPYQQGFETDTSGWVGTPSVTRVPSGTNGINSASGGWYAQTTNQDDSYQTGYGDGGYSFFGGNANYTGAFYQSIDVYIDTSLTQPIGYGEAFWIDMSPSSSSAYDVANNGGLGFGDEQNFRLIYSGANHTGTGVDVEVGAGGSPTVFDLTHSGWYRFTITYDPSGNPTDLVNTNMSIYDLSSSSLVGSASVMANQDGETLENQYLNGPGYAWLTVWQNGFSNDTLNIDNVQAGTVPEPTSVLLLASAVGMTGWSLRRKRARK